jgi:hypothetical protein
VLGDLLVTQLKVDLDVLSYISAVSVTMGMVLGIFVIVPVNNERGADGVEIDVHNGGTLEKDIQNTSSMQSEAREIGVCVALKEQCLSVKQALSSCFIGTLCVYWVFGKYLYIFIYLL